MTQVEPTPSSPSSGWLKWSAGWGAPISSSIGRCRKQRFLPGTRGHSDSEKPLILSAISEFPKWRKYLISLSFRDKSSVRPVQVGGFEANIVVHRSTAVRGRGGPPPPWESSCRTRTGPVEADGTVDAPNAPTAPWKTLRVFHELPQGLSHRITHAKPRKAPKWRWETRIDPYYRRVPSGTNSIDVSVGGAAHSLDIGITTVTLVTSPRAWCAPPPRLFACRGEGSTNPKRRDRSDGEHHWPACVYCALWHSSPSAAPGRGLLH